MPVPAKLTILLLIGLCAGGIAAHRAEASSHGDRQKCRSYGFQEGSDGFANCMMHLDERRGGDPPNRDARLNQYRKLSQQRQGDDRFPVCGAGNMDNELDIETFKWVGPNCQIAP